MCIYQNGDVSIEACNRAINSGRYSGVDLANAYINRAAELIVKKEYDRGISDTDVAIKLFPQSTLAYTNRGRAYQLKGDLKRAFADYSVAISHDPENPAAYINRASVREQQGDIKGAIADLKRRWRPSLERASSSTWKTTLRGPGNIWQDLSKKP